MYLQNFSYQNSEQLSIEILNRDLWFGAQTLVFQTPEKEKHTFAKFHFLECPLGYFPVSIGDWLYKEQVGHVLIISLAYCQVIENFFFKPLQIILCCL